MTGLIFTKKECQNIEDKKMKKNFNELKALNTSAFLTFALLASAVSGYQLKAGQNKELVTII